MKLSKAKNTVGWTYKMISRDAAYKWNFSKFSLGNSTIQYFYSLMNKSKNKLMMFLMAEIKGMLRSIADVSRRKKNHT